MLMRAAKAKRYTVMVACRGRASTVTNQNRTHYVHLMARYYMNDRISKQSRAFATGFKEIIPDRWLRIFSTPAQLQRLVRAHLFSEAHQSPSIDAVGNLSGSRKWLEP